ncbi:MAG: [FeFe] hydrogenase H-cluster radical SAM maturase HydE [Phycisphaerae bacterium]|jgi:biotin synthase
MNRQEIISWLRQTEPAELKKLWDNADRVRRENVGQAVYLRGLIEFSNICGRKCLYCGINAANTKLQRYQMSKAEIIDCAQTARKLGYGTVVLQSGENRKMDIYFLAETIKEIKQTADLAVTLSVGEWDREVYQLWKQAGADRFLMRFETGDDDLYRRLHPDSKNGVAERFEKLRLLKELGYEVGSGVMIGLPGQSYESLADDLLKFKQIGLDMIGAGPYIKHHDTLLGKNLEKFLLDDKNQTPATEEMTYKVIALARLLCPQANIPATTALATLNPQQGREQGLCCGANIVMPNVTPTKYRTMYEIYPAKACIAESAETCNACMLKRIESIGRYIGSGRGESPGFLARAKMGVGL